ncbi:MAG: hypothetical protein HY964_06605 [Ignavibacteriales bacterium]|nr:hypothetical protein [Ignavibacteriales bacterium]
MRLAFPLIFFLFIASCRDVESPSDLGKIDGYEVSGKVTNDSGIPRDSVMVSLYYYYDYLGNQQLDTIPVIITDTTQILDVSILSVKSDTVINIYHGRIKNLGPLYKMYWNGRDKNNKPVPSGLYYMTFSLDSLFIKRNSLIIDGNITTYTDQYGRFKITNANLPVGELFDAYNDDGSFYGVLKVEPKLALTLSKGSSYSEFESIFLKFNSVTKIALTLN